MRNYTDDINSVQETSCRQKVDNRLRRIANVLLINASFISNLGLLNGKMGIAIFFYNYARYTRNKIFSDSAGELVDEIYEEISNSTPSDFENGLTGIGWGIEYLVRNKFVKADADEVLADIDNALYRIRLQSPVLINDGESIFGYGLYYLARLYGHETDDNDLDTLIKKYHLIFLTDECERILMQKHYQRYKIDSLKINSVISFFWFLLEIERLKVFPAKAVKILCCIPEYVIDGLQNYEDHTGGMMLRKLTTYAIEIIRDKNIKNLLANLLRKNNPKELSTESMDESLAADFTKHAWQHLVYSSLGGNGEQYPQIERILSIIENEGNWKNRVNNINENNLGLTGLAGLGLGLITEQGSWQRAQSKELRAQSKGRRAEDRRLYDCMTAQHNNKRND